MHHEMGLQVGLEKAEAAMRALAAQGQQERVHASLRIRVQEL